MDATAKKSGLLRRLQMPGANRERLIGALDQAEESARGKEPEWAAERKKRKKKAADSSDFIGGQESVQILGTN